MNAHTATNREQGNALNDEIAGDRPRDRLYDSSRFFQRPDVFERDCVHVARRARVLDWAYQCLLQDQPEHIFNLNELASITLETIDRDMRHMSAMAETVRELWSVDRADLTCTKRELEIALEWLLRERNRSVAPDTIAALSEEIAEESARRDDAERGIPQGAVA